MIRFNEMILDGLFSYGLDQVIPLDKGGLYLLEGDNRDQGGSNGAGKTYLPDSLFTILYEQNSRGGDDRNLMVKDRVINEHLNVGAKGEVSFAKDGREYKVVYTRGWKGLGTDIYFYENVGGEWEDRRGESLQKTKEKIRDTLKLTYEQAKNICYMTQQGILAFVSGKDSDRERILTGILKLEVYDGGGKRARERIKEFNREITSLEGEVTGYDKQLEMFVVSGDEVKAVEKELVWLKKEEARSNKDRGFFKKEHNALEKEVKGIERVLIEKKGVLDSKREKHEDKLTLSEGEQVIEDRMKEIEEELDKIGKIGIVKESLKEVEETIDSLCVRMEESRENRAKLEEREKNLCDILEGIMQGAGVCDKCGSKVTGAKLKAFKSEKEKELKECEAEEDAEDKVYTDLLAQLGELKDKREMLTKAGDRDKLIAEKGKEENKLVEMSQARRKEVQILEKEIERLDRDLKKGRDSFDKKDKALDEIKDNVEKVEKELEGVLLGRKDKEYKLKELTERKEKRQEIQSLKKEAEKRVREIGDEKGYYDFWERHFSRVKNFKFDGVVEALNEKVNKYLALFGEAGGIQVHFSTRDLKTEAKKKDPKDLEPEDYIQRFATFVRQDGKKLTPLEGYSGGETQEVVLALMPAMWEVVEEQTSEGVNILFLDEVDKGLDYVRRMKLGELLQSIRRDDKTVICISHHDDFKDSVGWDGIWRVVKENGVSRLEMTE